MANSSLLNSDGVLNIIILSEGAVISSGIQVISIEVIERVNCMTSTNIILQDGDMPKGRFPVSDKDTFKPGAKIIVKAGYGTKVTEIFSGIVIKHSIKIGNNNAASLVLECKHPAVAMTVGRKNANFIDLKDSEIISKVVNSYSGFDAKISATETQHKELVQYNCTDWDFILARAETNGLLVTLDTEKVIVSDPGNGSSNPVLTVTYGTDIIDFQAELDATTQFDKVSSVGWDLATHKIVQQYSSSVVVSAQGNINSASLAKVLGLKSFQLQNNIPLSSTELTGWAKAQQMKSALARIRGHVRFQGSALVKAGTFIKLASVGERFNGTVFVSAVTHAIADGNWITTVDFGMSPHWFTEINNISPPAAAGVTASVSGLQIGVVMKLDADPESQYKIQVSVPIMQAEADGVWARLANFYGSNGVGEFFIPEIGDEVILGFFNDDPSHPVILGSLYSSKNKAPYELTADNFTKAIVTRSKLKIEFDDDKKIITIATPGKNTIVISDDGKSITLQDQSDNKVELNTSGITFESPKDIKMTAKGKITLTATDNIELTSSADIKQGGMNINSEAKTGFIGKGGATAEISSSSTTTIKGAMVLIN